MISTVDHQRVRELRLARPPVNALNPALIAALRDALAQAARDGCAGIVLSGAPGRFSGGLDVPELLRLGRPELRDTWEQFFALMKDIATSDVPIAAALTGHSPAGGTVLAIFTDYRLLADGPFLVGLNEVRVGLPVPEVLHRALVHVVGARQAERLAVGGLLLGPAEALRVGLVDEVVPADDVIPRAIAWVGDLLSRPPAAMTATRRLARRPLRDAFDAVTPAVLDAIADQWFSGETQSVMLALAAKLGKRG
ncbi:MAG: enoyl-CoA hydratase/isomerase family protein [Verrucomicrobiota bacterium]